MDILTRVEQEVVALHAFFQAWYSGAETSLARVSKVLSSEFELLSPEGDLLTKDVLLTELLADRGAFPNLKISVERLTAQVSDHEDIRAFYTEVHEEGGSLERRACCALLRLSGHPPRRLQWVAIAERYAD